MSWCKGGGEQNSPLNSSLSIIIHILSQILVKVQHTQQMLFENVHKNIINILSISFRKHGGGAKIIPCGPQQVTNAMFMQNIIKRHQLEHVFFSNFSKSKITHSKMVARCVSRIIIFNNKYWYLKTKYDQNKTSNRSRLHQSFNFFLREHAPNPIHLSSRYHYLFQYENNHFSFRVLLKYKVKRFNCSRFSKKFSGR